MENVRKHIETRIKTIPDFAEVSGVSDLQTALTGGLAIKGCYIYPLSDVSSEPLTMDGNIQRSEEQFGLAIIVRNVKSANGNDAADECFDLRELVREKLVGWVAPNLQYPMQKVSGRFHKLINGFYVWVEVYKTSQIFSNL